MKTLTLSLGLLAASAANAQLAYYTELDNTWTPHEKGDKDDLATTIYASGTYKFSETLSGTVEYSQDIKYITGGDAKLDQTHNYIRVPVTKKGLNWLGGDWKTSFTTRWTVPTNASAKQNGGWGSILLRPAFSLEGKIWSVNLRPLVSVPLVNRASQKYVLPGAQPAGINLLTYGLEYIPAYKISDKMALTLSGSITQSYKGGAAGADGAIQTAKLSNELILDIPLVTGPVSYAVSVSNDTVLNSTFKIFDAKTASYTFYVMASF
ncbi:MAG: hypothetical protein ABIR96_02065 [Bdellovibrionota bacterium]